MSRIMEEIIQQELQETEKKAHNEKLLRAKELLCELSDDLLVRATGVTYEELAQLRAGTLVPD